MGWFDKEMVDTHGIDELEMYNWTWIEHSGELYVWLNMIKTAADQ